MGCKFSGTNNKDDDSHAGAYSKRKMAVSSVRGRTYAVRVPLTGTVNDLWKALEMELDEKKSIAGLIYNGESLLSSTSLQDLKEDDKITLVEKETIRIPLTRNEIQMIKQFTFYNSKKADFLKAVFIGHGLNECVRISRSELANIIRWMKKGKDPSDAELSVLTYYLEDDSGDLSLSFEEFLKLELVYSSAFPHLAVGVFKLFNLFTGKNDRVLTPTELDGFLDLICETMGNRRFKLGIVDSNQDITLSMFIEGFEQAFLSRENTSQEDILKTSKTNSRTDIDE